MRAFLRWYTKPLTGIKLDYSCGVIPVTKVDRTTDQLQEGFQFKRLNRVAKGAYLQYNADKMHGLPVAVQVVGRRLEEEKVLAVLERVEATLEQTSGKYKILEIE